MLSTLANSSCVLPNIFAMFRFLGHLGSLVEFLNEKCLHKELLFDIRRLAYYLKRFIIMARP
jgi:hypothetical protein